MATAKETSQPATAQQSASEITEDSALQFLEQTQGDETFDEYQATRAKDQTSTTQPNVSHTDVDDDEGPALQQALLESRQQSQAQQQGSDPSASSSAAARRTIQEEILDEIQVGQIWKLSISSCHNGWLAVALP